MDEIRFKTEDFEGPLDLLLHLIAKKKMELYDIRIYELIDQYLAFMSAADTASLDPASEFIEMAARLVYMKSVALLPRSEEQQELERELTGQLVEYHLCKKAAQRLRDMAEGVNFYVREPLEIRLDSEYSLRHEPQSLLEAYMSIMGKGARLAQPGTAAFEPIVTAPIVSVESRVVRILRMLRGGQARRLGDFFAGVRGRSESVATFLGVLELIKAGRIAVADDGSVAFNVRHKETAHEH
ncbi:MAG: segregation/condensation protein A [Oscillospiraceae bacterium]|nr:segregation/condensation protein A [Oscillospiraceae bacterium]